MTNTMTRNEILLQVKQYFSIEELVCKDVRNLHGEKAWNFLDTNLLHVLLILRRDILKTSLVCNDYKWGGKNSQRGLRCNLCEIVKGKKQPYLSQHCMGKAVDLVSKNMTAAEMRKRIKANSALLPCNVRIEKDVTWLHIDVMDMGIKVYEF